MPARRTTGPDNLVRIDPQFFGMLSPQRIADLASATDSTGDVLFRLFTR